VARAEPGDRAWAVEPSAETRDAAAPAVEGDVIPVEAAETGGLIP
jgi:hypothetical protein